MSEQCKEERTWYKDRRYDAIIINKMNKNKSMGK